MRRVVAAALALAVVLAVPFLARSTRVASAPRAEEEGARQATGPETLVILTPHNEAIRSEMGRGFREHMARLGRTVEIDWRSPGGSAEITRYLSSQYTASFQQHWTRTLGRRWSSEIAAGFSRPAPSSGTPAAAPSPEVDEARRAYLASNVGAGVDLLFGGGSPELARNAAAGRLVDSGIRARRPEWFGPGGIPERVGGERYWDAEGRWVGACLSAFGICFNRDALARLGLKEHPASWGALGEPVYFGELALADPTKSGSVGAAFEMIIQSRMNEARRRASAEDAGLDDAALDRVATRDGWTAAMRLIRRIAANARYFTDAGTRVPMDVAGGDAAAGMCIDFYGRFQREVSDTSGGTGRVGFVTARGETAINADPIGLLRGAPHPALALDFIEFVLSEEGQKLWAFKRGVPGGPVRYTLHRLPIVPHLYDHAFDADRADPDENPYVDVGDFVFRQAFTANLSGAIAFVVRVMGIDPGDELSGAYRALIAARFPPRATALFDDVSAVDYVTVTGPLRAALQSSDPLDGERAAVRLVSGFRAQYREVARLARQGQ